MEKYCRSVILPWTLGTVSLPTAEKTLWRWKAAATALCIIVYPRPQPGTLAPDCNSTCKQKYDSIRWKAAGELDLTGSIVPGQVPNSSELLFIMWWRKGSSQPVAGTILCCLQQSSTGLRAASMCHVGEKRVIEITNAVQGELWLAGLYIDG